MTRARALARAPNSSQGALVVSVIALAISLTGVADAARHAVVAVLRPGDTVRLDKHRKISVAVLPKLPLSVLPKLPASLLGTPPLARNSAHLAGKTLTQLTAACPSTSVDLGSWCLGSSPYSPTASEIGKTNYFFASQKCVDLGGWLPTAAQLIGAATHVKLASTITDSDTTASIDEDATDGLKDKREMTATLVTTAAGSSAAGSEGVSNGSRGDPRVGEPDPATQPANPSPDTLQYVTVYDNADNGGFAGSNPVLQPATFRCAYNKTQNTQTTNQG